MNSIPHQLHDSHKSEYITVMPHMVRGLVHRIITESQNSLGFKMFKDSLVQHTCLEQGHLSTRPGCSKSIQSGLRHLQRWGIHSFSFQSVSGFQHLHSNGFPPCTFFSLNLLPLVLSPTALVKFPLPSSLAAPLGTGRMLDTVPLGEFYGYSSDKNRLNISWLLTKAHDAKREAQFPGINSKESVS